VYLICSPKEYNEALSLKKCLEADRKFGAILPIRDVDDASIRLQDHRATLRSCDGVLVYWGGKSDVAWFRQQQREVIGARQKRRTKPLPGLCLSSYWEADAEANDLPDLPFKKVTDIECSSVRRFFTYLEVESHD
jgi:hypothetical protein